MELTTKRFGAIEVDKDRVITFEEGIPGFTNLKEYILLQDENTSDGDTNKGLFWWLQSVEDGDVAFVLINVYIIMPEYNPLIDKEEIAGLGEYSEEDFLVFNIAVIPKDIKEMRINLRAPVVINSILKKGKQVIVKNEEYGIRHRVFDTDESKG